MKIRSLILSSLACAAFCACSSDDIVDAVDNGTQTPAICPTDRAFIAVNIVNADAGTKGTAGEPPYYYGTAEEHVVATADFYFYNADGDYVGKGKAWDGKDANGTGTGTTNNIELESNKFVVLDGLTGKTYPKYMVAVLNQESSLENMTLAEVEGKLQVENALSNELNKGHFVMSNSTYNHNNAGTRNFAVEVSDNNFLLETPNMDEMTTDNVVTIHVERLAAKVQVSLAGNLGNKIQLTKPFEVDGVAKPLTVNVLGWGLNGTNKTSYLMKRIGDPDKNLGFTWNGSFRTFWAHSPNYNGGNYPADWNTLNTLGDNATLNYVSWNDLAITCGEADYCKENTNTAEKLKDGAFHSKLTEVLIKAQLEGFEDEDLLRYEGKLYTSTNYIARVLHEVAPMGTTFWKKTGEVEGATTYKELEASDVEYVNAHDGNVTVVLTDDAKKAEWFTDANGTKPATAADVQTAIDNVKPTAQCYHNGMMYYNVPIEHLRGGTFSYNEANELQVNEADYGVVRNHYYMITVSKIENLGTAVYDPTENIVPNDKDKTTYYIGSVIKILSWKIVNQNVEL
mgnify:CR=1 FL=1